MASIKWRGGAQAVAQVTTVTVTAYDAATTYRLTCNGKVVSAAGVTNANATATALAEAWNDSEEPEMAEATASTTGASGVITLTGATAGLPFTVTSSVSGGTGTIGAATQVTAPTGPNHWDNAVNWSGGAVPVNSDDVFLEDSSDAITFGLAQSAVTLASLNVAASFTGTLGLPEANGAGYVEYRATELAVGATALNVGQGPGQGSGRLRVNLGSVQTAAIVTRTGASLDGDAQALRLRGTNASNTLEVRGGTVGVAAVGGTSATVATLRVSGGRVLCGVGTTLTTVVQSGGAMTLNSALTTLTKTGGDCTIQGTGAVGTVTNDAGLVSYMTSGTLSTACRVGSGATLDFSGDLRAKTVTPLVSLHSGGALLDPAGVVTYTNGVQLVRCDLNEATLLVGQDRTLTVA